MNNEKDDDNDASLNLPSSDAASNNESEQDSTARPTTNTGDDILINHQRAARLRNTGVDNKSMMSDVIPDSEPPPQLPTPERQYRPLCRRYRSPPGGVPLSRTTVAMVPVTIALTMSLVVAACSLKPEVQITIYKPAAVSLG